MNTMLFRKLWMLPYTQNNLLQLMPIGTKKLFGLSLSFFRVYADGFHHHKEEEILFPEMSKKNDLLGDGVIKEMLENHQDFRDMLQGIENFLEQKNYAKVQQKLMAYTDALQDHIAVENDEVFQVAEALLDPGELERIYFQFCDADRETDDKLSGDNRHTKQQLVVVV